MDKIQAGGGRLGIGVTGGPAPPLTLTHGRRDGPMRVRVHGQVAGRVQTMPGALSS